MLDRHICSAVWCTMLPSFFKQLYGFLQCEVSQWVLMSTAVYIQCMHFWVWMMLLSESMGYWAYPYDVAVYVSCRFGSKWICFFYTDHLWTLFFLSYIDYELVDVIRQPQASEHFSEAGSNPYAYSSRSSWYIYISPRFLSSGNLLFCIGNTRRYTGTCQ